MALQKGKFYDADKKREIVTCHFNPNELSISKSNTWNEDKAAGSSLADLNFGGEGAQTLSMKLVFDTYEKRKDVRTDIEKLMKLMEVPNGASDARPPHVEFGWGQYRSFRSVIKSISTSYTLFLETGIPVRANVSVTLQEVPKGTAASQKKGQNPTSHAVGVQKVRTIQPGDTLDLITAQETGDPTQWRAIADFNNLDDPRRLKPGMTLLIPPDL